MDRVSRPLIGLLVATVACLALWVTALKPTSSGSSGSKANPNAGQLNGAIAAAHNAVATSNAASVAHGGTIPAPTTSHPAAPAPASAPPTTATPPVSQTTTPAAHAARPARPTHPARLPQTPATRLDTVRQALENHKVLALLFFNAAAADDRAVQHELATVPTRGGSVVKLAIPLSELSRYAAVTNQVPVTGSPTLVLVDRARAASTIVGFADRFEIAQRVNSALVAP